VCLCVCVCVSVCLSVSKSTEGLLPLHVACLYGSQGCLEVLLDVISSIEVKSVDDVGRSALHAAAVSGFVFMSVYCRYCVCVCLCVCLYELGRAQVDKIELLAPLTRDTIHVNAL